MASPSPTVQLVQKLLTYSYAIFNYGMFFLLGLVRGGFSQPEEQHFLKLAVAQDQLWNLSKQPVAGFHHAFYKLRTGLQLHYIHNRVPNASSSPTDLFVFIHGFPDSSMSWRRLLEESTMPKNATFVCVDLPGYGGSDSMDRYDCRVLDALSEFVVAMREQYTQDENGATKCKTYVVGHDWGCVLTFRLAADAPGLADRFLVSNGPLVDHAKTNAYSRLGSAAKIFKQFRSAPTQNFGLLAKSFQVVKPVLYQVWLSGYITVFQLPKPLISLLGSAGNMFFPRAIAEVAHGRDTDKPDIPGTIGGLRPGPLECSSVIAQTKETYSASVLARAESPGLAFWHMTSYYKDGLSYLEWEKSLETVTDLYNIENEMSEDGVGKRRSSSASSALFSEQYKGSVRAPLTMLWGGEDSALSKTMCLEGIGDYLAKDSEVILLPRTGHWTALEKESRAVWVKVLSTLVERNQATANKKGGDGALVNSSVLDQVKQVYSGASLVVRR